MAIQLRRGNEADLDISQLKPGEAAVCLDSGKIIVKLSGGNYLTLTDTDAIQEIVAGKAAASHTHAQSDITGLETALAGKADATATQTALNSKADATATQTALAGKQNVLTAGANITIETVNDVLTISATGTTYSAATTSAAGLMSAADFKKINPQSILANTDLDSITADGWYYCDANATVATLSNCPTNRAFYLEVHTHVGKYQHLVEYSLSGAKHYHRNFFGSWGSWVQWKLTDTWVPNSSSAAGYVANGSGQADKVWKTDANGNPAWRDEINYLFTSTGVAHNLTPSTPLTISGDSFYNYKITIHNLVK